MKNRQCLNRLLGGSLFIAGTTIGAGMVALPIITGIAGFWPATLLMIGAFIYMLLNMFLLLEANFYCQSPRVNIIGMAKQLIGIKGEWIAWCAFLLLLYAASAAYIDGCAELMSSVLTHQLSVPLGMTPTAWIFTAFMGTIAYFGIRWMDWFNRILMTGLILTYLLSTFTLLPHITWQHLTHHHSRALIYTIPVVVLSFTAHIVLPSLRSYLNDDIKLIKQSTLLGMGIPLIMYIVWQATLTGLLPYQGPDSITAISQSSTPLGSLTQILAHNPQTTVAATSNAFFSFFAMLTTLIGCILALSDFLADGFKVKPSQRNRLFLILGSLLPPLLFALIYPAGFISALHYAGVAVAILYGILPAWMVWRARYINQLTSTYSCGGNKWFLGSIIFISVCVIVLEIVSTQHWISIN